MLSWNESLLDIQCDRNLSKAFLWPSGRLSTAFPWQAHKLTIAFFSVPFRVHILVRLAFAFYLLFIYPFLCVLPHPPPLSLSIFLTAFTSLSSPLNLKSESFCFFLSYHLLTLSTAYRFYVCLYFIGCMNVWLFLALFWKVFLKWGTMTKK